MFLSVVVVGGHGGAVSSMEGCSQPAGCLWRGPQATKKWPQLGLCLPQTPWSRVSKKQKQDLSVPQSSWAATVARLPWVRLVLPGTGQCRTPQKTAPKSSQRLEPERPGIRSAWRDEARERASRASPHRDTQGHGSRPRSRRTGGPT